MVVKLLRKFLRCKMIAQRDEQISVGCLRHAAANIETTRDGTLLPKNYGRSIEPGCFAFDQAGAQNGNAAAAIRRLGVANEDRVRAVEVTCEQYIHEPGLALGVNAWDVPECGGHLAGSRNNTYASGPLGHQHAAIG